MRIRPSCETLWQLTAKLLPKCLLQELLLRDLTPLVRIRGWHESRCGAMSLEQLPRPPPESELGFRPFLAELFGVPIRRTGQVSPLVPRHMARQKEWHIEPAIRLFSMSMERPRQPTSRPKIFSYFFLSQSLL